MSKLKARIDNAVARDLGIELSSIPTTLKEVTGNPDSVCALILAFEIEGIVHYDLLPVWRYINGMRIKIPKFQSHPIIEERLVKKIYKRYYVLCQDTFANLKLDKPNDLRANLPFRIGDDHRYQTTMVVTGDTMGLRKKPLLFHRRRPKYAS